MNELFKLLEINTIPISLLEKSFYYYKKDERLFLFYKLEKQTSLKKIQLFLTELSTRSKRKEIIEKLKNGDIYFDVKSFLWDLYLIIIDENYIISREQKSKIERDKFIARKKIIQGENEEQIIKQLKNILFNKHIFENKIKSVKSILENDENQILKEIMKSENNEIKNIIQKELNIETELKLEDIAKYLDKLKTEYPNN